MIAKDRFALADTYTDANTFKIITGKQVTLYAFNNSVTYQVFRPSQASPGLPQDFTIQPEESTSPGTIFFPGANGIRLRNAASGLSPAPLCSVRVYDIADVVGQGFNPITTQVSATGAVVIGSELAYNEFTADVNIAATTEPTATTVVTAGSITVDGTSKVLVEFFAPNWLDSSGTRTITFCLYEDGSSIGQIWRSKVSSTGTVTGLDGVHAMRRFTPLSGSHVYSIRAFIDAATVSVQAGAGGSGNRLPGYIRITQAG